MTVLQQAESGPTNMRAPDHRPAPPDKRLRYILITFAAAALLLIGVGAALIDHPAIALGVVLLAAPVAVHLSGSLVDFYLWMFAPRKPPPRQLSAAEAVPALAATAAIYPVIVHAPSDVDNLLDGLRDAREATREGIATHLALVDFADSDTPARDTDPLLRKAIEDGIAVLNGHGDGAPVTVLFRHRRWNEHEGVFMGWERKRGKLEELTDLMVGRTNTSFDLDSPAAQAVAERLSGIRYLLTMDAGNRLLPGGVLHLVATIAHPANAAEIDPETGLVRRGFAFVGPTDVPAPAGTAFEWALQPYAIPEGEMPMAQAVFGEDGFYGQGVIDVAAYRAVLAGRLPSNRVLSHDKLEGMHGRTATIADARVIEANIPDYLQYRRRQHRWIRGDAQLLPWIAAPRRLGLRQLPWADRLQMTRDIFAHLFPASAVALLALGWLAAPVGEVGWWTGAIIAILAQSVVLSPMFPLITAARLYANLRKNPDLRRRRGSRHPGRKRPPRLLPIIARKSAYAAGYMALVEAGRVLLWLPLLADRALIAVDALARAGYRMSISHRYTLQWTSSAQESRIGSGLGTRLRHLWPSCAIALLLAVAVVVAGTARLAAAGPLLIGWLAAPAFAYWTARPARWLPRPTP